MKSWAILLGGTALLAACNTTFDGDFRSLANGLDTSSAALSATAARPAPDSRGIITYPNYQVAIARTGDSVSSIAGRIGVDAGALARYNGLTANTTLRGGEVLALPQRVAGDAGAGGITGGAISSQPLDGGVDIATLAGDAINRAGTGTAQGTATSAAAAGGVEPIRHKVERGETAFTIARLYNVSVRSLADWNGLGADFAVREGQILLIPVVIDDGSTRTTETSAPGTGSVAPVPPSAAAPLPAADVAPQPAEPAPASPELGGADDEEGFVMPVSGKVIRAFQKGKNDGIDIAADAGTPVLAAADGYIRTIMRDTNQVPIIIIDHGDDLLTIYAGVDGETVKEKANVKRGQKIAVVRAGSPSFLHFEVRRRLESLDPMDFLP